MIHDEFEDKSLVELKPGWFIRELPGEPFWYMQTHFARHDPIFTPAVLGTILVGTMVAGTVMQMRATAQQGKMAQELANARAEQERKRAELVKKEAKVKAELLEEKKRRLIAASKVGFAASNVRLNIGAPLIVEAQTKLDVAKDKGYILEMGEKAAESHMISAAYETAYGKMARQQAKWQSLSTGLLGFGQAGMMGYEAGLFNFNQPMWG